ncbi:hypothetical protein ACI2VA_04425 [Ralstonia nicotianae]
MLAGLFGLVGMVGLYAWAWHRIVRTTVARGRPRWLGHGIGFLFGQLPAVFFIVAIAVTFPTPTQKPVGAMEIAVLWAFVLGVIAATWNITREPIAKSDVTPRLSVPPAAQQLKNWAETLRDALHDDVPGDVRRTAPHSFDKTTPAARPVAIPHQTREAAPRRPVSAESIQLPDAISFLYRKADGQVRRRSATVYLAELDGDRPRIDGHDHDRNATRTFLLERIQSDITRLATGEILAKSVWCAAVTASNGLTGTRQRRKKAVAPKRESADWQTAVFFAGFREAHQQRLEQHAVTAGWQVRAQLSRSVDYMVAGPLAGHRQFEKAEDLGIPVIDEDAFSALV